MPKSLNQSGYAIYILVIAIIALAISVLTLYKANNQLNKVEEAEALTKPRWYIAPTPDPSSTDKVPPSVSITNPTEGAELPRNSTYIMYATASDDVAMQSVEFLFSPYANLDEKLFCFGLGPNPIPCQLKTPSKPGPYKLVVRGYDTAGNMSSTSVNVVVK